LTIGDSLPLIIEIDAKRIKQIMFILIYNSLKYTSQGHIKIEACMKSRLRSDFLKIKVTDTGCGIDSQLGRNIFSLFHSASKKKRANFAGLGSGLTIIKRIVDKLNGKIKFSSVLNWGTTFSIILPVEQPLSESNMEYQAPFTDRG
jgi:signal transduction histidine kinase